MWREQVLFNDQLLEYCNKLTQWCEVEEDTISTVSYTADVGKERQYEEVCRILEERRDTRPEISRFVTC